MEIFALLRERFRGLALEQHFSFARHTTIGCGGTASVCAYPSDTETLQALLVFLEKQDIPHCFLGAGANVLPSDESFEGVVVRFSRMNSLAVEGEELLVGAGVTGGALLRAAKQYEIGGFEFLTGIPTSVGGATVMNAGVAGRHLADIVVSVTAVEKGKIREFSHNDCGFFEKTSVFQSGIAVTAVRLRGAKSSVEEIAARRNAFQVRRSHLPKGRSMGCVFVNPPDVSAGALIDECGLKGYTLGGARVSERHANFILNDGGTSAEIAALIEIVKSEVFRKTGILLKEEIKRLP